MKKKILYIFLVAAIFCTACQNTEDEPKKTKDMRKEIAEVLQSASYENIEILFDEIEYYEGQDLVLANVWDYNVGENMSYEEAIEMCIEKIFPALLEVDKVDKNDIYDLYTDIGYDEIVNSLDEYDTLPEIYYTNSETYTELYYSVNWKAGVYISQGILGNYASSCSPFAAYGVIEDVKTYDCRFDDLSDTYTLLDGDKTVEKAKMEIENYLNSHYPIVEIDNGFENEVYRITAGKIKGTDYYAYKACRTVTYDGIPVREMPSSQDHEEEEFTFMAECAMCESNKLDVTLGIINNFEKPTITHVIEEPIPFSEVMERVAYYLTGETKFQLIYGGIEYRMFYIEKNSDNYQMIPYWCFVAENPNDDTKIKIYVDIETGEVNHYAY